MSDLTRLNFTFTTPSLLIGGKAMEYYNLRLSGADVDFVITAEDYDHLARQYPDYLKDLGGDLGVCVFEFEIMKIQQTSPIPLPPFSPLERGKKGGRNRKFGCFGQLRCPKHPNFRHFPLPPGGGRGEIGEIELAR